MFFLSFSCVFTADVNEREKSNFVATITKFCDKNHNENYFGNKFNAETHQLLKHTMAYTYNKRTKKCQLYNSKFTNSIGQQQQQQGQSCKRCTELVEKNHYHYYCTEIDLKQLLGRLLIFI